MSDPKRKGLDAAFDAEQDLSAAFDAEADLAAPEPEPAAVAAPAPVAAAPPPLDMGAGDDPVGLGQRGAPMLGPSSPLTWEDVQNTLNDSVRGANAGLTWGGSDKLVGLANAAARGEDPGVAIAREESLSRQAQERSPILYPAFRAAGYIPGMLVAGAGSLAGGGATALDAALSRVGAAGIQGLTSGALSAPSATSASEVADRAIEGGATDSLLSAFLQLPGMGASWVGNRMARGTPQPIPPEPAPPAQGSLPGMAPPQPAPAQPPQGPFTAPGLMQRADQAAADPEYAQQVMRTTAKLASIGGGGGAARHGFDPLASGASALAGLGLSDEIGKLAQGAAPPMLRGLAAGAKGVGNTLDVLGQGARAAGVMEPGVAGAIRDQTANASAPRIDDMAGPASPAAATSNGRGNLLPEAAMTALQHDPAALGKYQSQFAEAMVSRDPNAVGALISRLTQTDPAFRTTVLPGLQRRTTGGDAQRSPSGY